MLKTHSIAAFTLVELTIFLFMGGFKAESLLGHITRKASSPSLLIPPLPFPSLPSSLPSLLLPHFPLSLPSPPLEGGPSNPAKGPGGTL